MAAKLLLEPIGFCDRCNLIPTQYFDFNNKSYKCGCTNYMVPCMVVAYMGYVWKQVSIKEDGSIVTHGDFIRKLK